MLHADKSGQLAGDYQLVHRLSAGNFGEVYLGKHTRTREQVAVKVLYGRLSSSSDLKDFINEARTIRLKHPHIVSLLNFGITSDDVPYLVMEYAPNGTLRDRHPKGTRVPLAVIVSYLIPLASALQYAHDQHLIHRDVKPENMLVGAGGRLLLSDFGIATVAQSSRLMDAPGSVGGTLPYMAPEQLNGRPRPASDQYALAIVTYEWLTGVRPFNGTLPELVTQHTTTPPLPLREHLPDLSNEVEQVVLTALAKDPKSRFATVQAFAYALAQATQPTHATDTISRISRPNTPIRSESHPPALSIPKPSSMVLLPTGAPLMMEPMPSVSPAPLIAACSSTRVDVNHTAHVTTPSISHLLPSTPTPMPPKSGRSRKKVLILSFLLLVLLMGSISIIWITITTNDMHVTATVQTRATITASINAYEHFAASAGVMFGVDGQHTHSNPFEQILNPTTVSSLEKAWAFPTSSSVGSSPAVADGVVYIGSYDHHLYAIDAATGRQKWSFATGDFIHSSPAVAGGAVYVGSSDHHLYAIDAATGRQKWSFATGDMVNSSPAVAGSVVYVDSYDGRLYAIDAATGRQKWSFATTSGPYTYTLPSHVYSSSPAVAGGVVYVGSSDHHLYAIDAATGRQKWSFATGDMVNSSPTVADGVVYVGSSDHHLYAFHLL